MARAGAFGEVEEVQALLPLVHVFTHYKLHIVPHQVALAARARDAANACVVEAGRHRTRAAAGAGQEAARRIREAVCGDRPRCLQ